jgi:uncharacterized protein RhaS with RHS repeats
LGRFLQTDPIRFEAGDGNLYRYVSNNPINSIDPTGEIAFVIPAAYYGYAAAAAGAAYLATPAGQQALRDFGRALAGLLNDIGDALFNENSAEEENDAVDGEGKACPAGELKPTGETREEPAKGRKARDGGKAVEEGFVDSAGRPVTRQTVYDKHGRPVHGPHYRPGGFKIPPP